MALFKPRRSGNDVSLANQHPFTNLPLIISSGLGRSGTTVLRHCLGSHSKIACFNEECNYVFELMRAAHSNLDDKGHRKTLPVTLDSYWEVHRQMLLNLFWPTERWEEPNAFQAISTYSMLDPRASIGLKESFPNLAICYIVRNGIEVVSSYVSFPAFQYLDFRQVCRLWALRKDMLEYESSNKQVFLFRFEWLKELDRFQNLLSEALASIGLEFEQSCLDPLETRFHPTAYPGETREAANDLLQRRDRWKFWSNAQRDDFVEICGDAMHAYGYEIPWE